MASTKLASVLNLERTYPLLILAIVLARIASGSAYRNGPEIRSDGVGYHAWTRAIVTRDFSFCEWARTGPNFFSFSDPARGVCQNKYPVGLALLRLPVMAFLVDLSPGAPLISDAEHRASAILSALALWITVALIAWTLSMLNVPPGRANAVLVITLLATGLFHYGTYDGSFTHVYSALFCSLLCALAVRQSRYGHRIPNAAIFASAFFLIAIRTTNIFLLICMSVAYLALRNWALNRQMWGAASLVVAGTAAAVGLQVSYNFYVHNALMFSTYGEESFLFDRPMQDAVLLSYERGLLTYQPIFGLAAVCALATRSARGWGWLLLGSIVAYVTLYGYWHSWMLGGGMGHRGFVELAPLVSISLGLVWRDAPGRWLSIHTTFGAFCTMVTVSIMLGYWAGTYPFGGATSHHYWTHVLGNDLGTEAPATAEPKRKKK